MRISSISSQNFSGHEPTREWQALSRLVEEAEEPEGEELDKALWNLSIILGRTYRETRETYSYLEENASKVQGLNMNGVAPTYENIASFEYPGARPLYVYVKKAHIGAIQGLSEFLTQWTTMWDKGGELAKIGLVANPDDVRARSMSAATNYDTLDGSELK